MITVEMNERELDTAKFDADNWLRVLKEAESEVGDRSGSTKLAEAITKAEDRASYWKSM